MEDERGTMSPKDEHDIGRQGSFTGEPKGRENGPRIKKM